MGEATENRARTTVYTNARTYDPALCEARLFGTQNGPYRRKRCHKLGPVKPERCSGKKLPVL